MIKDALEKTPSAKLGHLFSSKSCSPITLISVSVESEYNHDKAPEVRVY